MALMAVSFRLSSRALSVIPSPLSVIPSPSRDLNYPRRPQTLRFARDHTVLSTVGRILDTRRDPGFSRVMILPSPGLSVEKSLAGQYLECRPDGQGRGIDGGSNSLEGRRSLRGRRGPRQAARSGQGGAGPVPPA